MAEFFLPHNLTFSQALQSEGSEMPADSRLLGLLYRPVLLAQAAVRLLNRKYNLDCALKRTVLVAEPDRRGLVRWQNFLIGPVQPREFDRNPIPEARFAALDAPFSDERTLRSMEADFEDWLYRATDVTVRANEALGVYAGPEVSEAEFAQMCQEAAAAEAEIEADRLEDQLQRKIDSLETKLAREERELEEDKAEHSRRRTEELATHAETLFSLFSRRRRSVSSSMTKRRMTARAGEDVEESEEEIKLLKKEIDELEADMQAALDDLEEKWTGIAADITEIKVTPYKKDISVELFGVAWMPYHLVEAGGRMRALAGFEIRRTGELKD